MIERDRTLLPRDRDRSHVDGLTFVRYSVRTLRDTDWFDRDADQIERDGHRSLVYCPELDRDPDGLSVTAMGASGSRSHCSVMAVYCLVIAMSYFYTRSYLFVTEHDPVA